MLYLPILYLSLIFPQVDVDTLWTFTNCGQEGRFGPELGQCEAEYLGTSLEGQITMDGFQGYQEWTVPYFGTYSIEVWGAAGGIMGGFDGNIRGLGVRMKGTFILDNQEILMIAVGQKGQDIGCSDCSAGGGGGTFVAYVDSGESSQPLIVSGGAGGAGDDSHGSDAVISEYAPGNYNPGEGGYGEYGGNGGGGFYSNGVDGFQNYYGFGFRQGAIGGTGSNSWGGFGGGSGGRDEWGTAGGGFTGGYACDCIQYGGAGSYNSGENQNNIPGVNEGHGQVVITLIQTLVIDHTPLSNSADIQGPYLVTINATSINTEIETPILFYSINGGDFMEVSMLENGDDTFTAEIPGQPLSTRIDYYISSFNSNLTLTTETYTFYITLVDDLTNLSGYSRPDGTIDLYWDAPSYPDGVSPTNLSIYRSEVPGVTQDDLIAEGIALSELTYFDADIINETTYYYKLGLFGEVDGQSYTVLISNETQVFSNEEETLSITGQVLLDGTEDNSGVLVEFFREYPENTYTATTDIDGNFNLQIPQSTYNILFSKFGWQPYDLNNQYISNDTEFFHTLEQGYAAYVQGDASGIWSEENLYFVEGNITVPESDTLTIEAGTRIKFMGEYQFSVEGVLIAEGDNLNHIEFTSGQTTPIPGDWGILSLHSPGNILKYVDIRYAGNGISGEDINGSVFDHCSIAEIPYWADDARINCHGIEAENCQNCTFSYNLVEGDIMEGIMIEHDGSGSSFTGNVINTLETYMALGVGEGDSLIFIDNIISTDGIGIQLPSGTNLIITNNTINSGSKSIYGSNINSAQVSDNSCEGSNNSYAIDMSNCTNCLFEANEINYTSGSGIQTNNSENTTISGNSLDVNNRGIQAESGNELDISDNDITGFDEYGIVFNSTSTSNIFDNTLVSTPNNNSSNYGIYNMHTNSYGNTVYNNNIHILDAASTVEGISINNVDVHDNAIIIDNGSGNNYGIRGENNTIFNNNITLNSSSTSSYAIYNTNSYIQKDIYNNQIELIGIASGIKGKRLHIHDNDITGSGTYSIYITGNMEQNTLIENNTVSGKVRISNYAVLEMHHNLVTSTTGGLEIDNWAGGHFYNNTFVGEGSGTGLYIYNFDLGQAGQTLIVENNIFSGFNIGVNVVNEITSIRFNNINSSSTSDFIGAGLPDNFGIMGQENNNGDDCDAQYNIYLDPQFVYPDVGNYNLLLGSPLIDAGQPDMIDPDETISDIGAFYRDKNAPADSLGCTDEIACNYIPGATQDNGGCTYPPTWYWDEDGDGLGVEESTEVHCDQPDDFVANADDLDPQCETNDTDDCGICGGGNADQDCNGDCFGEAGLDDCGVCSGGGTGYEPNSDQDCNGECFGEAYIDGCSNCVGGTTGLEPCPDDCNGVYGGTAVWDDCQVCSGGDTGHAANSDMDCASICYGDNIGDSFDGCCLLDAIDGCGQCNGNDWDNCDADGDDIGNYEQWGHGAYSISVEDVPEDQGGRVYITFNKSFYDTDFLRSTESYQIERLDEQWVGVATQNAYGNSTYIVEATTLINSDTTQFRVIASMEEGNFICLENGFGASIDNIDPAIPTALMATTSGGLAMLSWDEPVDADFQYFTVFRNGELLDYTIESTYTDNISDEFEYHLTATDSNGNESDASESITVQLTVEMHTGLMHASSNLKSFYAQPEDASIATLFSPLIGQLDAVLGEGVAAFYIDELGWVGTLQEIDVKSGYWLNMSEEADFSFSGYAVDPNMEYSLHAGYNLISFPSHGSVDISDGIPDDIEGQFLSIIGEGSCAMNECTTYEGGTWLGSLNTFEGSKGYWVEVQSDLTFSFDLTNLSENVVSRQSTLKAPTGYDYRQSSLQAFYFIENISGINTGDWILAYHGDMIIGARQWTGKMTDVPAMGDEGNDFTKGYIKSGSTPQFKLLSGNKLIELTGEVPTWSENQIFMVSSLRPLPESYSLSSAYPNPFNPVTTLEFGLPLDGNVFIDVYNIQGRLVETLAKGHRDAGYHFVVWNADIHASGVYFVKMVAGEYVKTQKLMLVK